MENKMTFCDGNWIKYILILTVICKVNDVQPQPPLTGQETCYEWISTKDAVYRHHCYWVNSSSTQKISTFHANYICEQHSGKLAPYIDDFLFNELCQMIPTDGTKSWIGLNDLRTEDEFVNWDGETTVVNVNHWLQQNAGSNPNGGRTQNCVEVSYYSGGPCVLQDRDCNVINQYTPQAFICYIDKTHNGTQMFVKSKAKINFFRSQELCQGNGIELVSLTNDSHLQSLYTDFQNEISLRQNYVENKPSPWYYYGMIGTNKLNTNEFVGIDGSLTNIDLSLVTTCPKCACLVIDCSFTCSLKAVDCEEEIAYWSICTKRKMMTIQDTPSPCNPDVETSFPSAPTTSSVPTTSTQLVQVSENNSGSACIPVISFSNITMNNYVPKNMTTLAIDRKNTSAYRRSLRCADDNSIVSVSIGWVGAAVLITVFGLIVFTDISNFYTQRQVLENGAR